MERLGGTLRSFCRPHSRGLRTPKNICAPSSLDRSSLRTEASSGPKSGYGAVDGAVKRVNQWLSLQNQCKTNGREGSSALPWAHGRKRNLKIRVQKRASEEIREASEVDRTLKSYLVLPPEEYSVLDPKYVKRNPCKGPSAFLITIPLDEMLGIDLTPIVSVQVHVNKASDEVRFVVDGFTFGKPDVDKYVDIQIQSTLYSTSNDGRFRRLSQLRNVTRFRQHERDASKKQDYKTDDGHVKESLQNGVRCSLASANDRACNILEDNGQSIHGSSWEGGEKTRSMPGKANSTSDHVFSGGLNTLSMLDEEEDIHTNYSVDPFGLSASGLEHDRLFQSGDSELDGKKVRLHCCVRVQFTTVIPPALSFIPNPVLGSVGRILLRAVLNALLPNFLDLASRDYQRWVSGQRTCHVGVGSLVRV